MRVDAVATRSTASDCFSRLINAKPVRRLARSERIKYPPLMREGHHALCRASVGSLPGAPIDHGYGNLRAGGGLGDSPADRLAPTAQMSERLKRPVAAFGKAGGAGGYTHLPPGSDGERQRADLGFSLAPNCHIPGGGPIWLCDLSTVALRRRPVETARNRMEVS